jgi:hypothetical protein
MGQEQLDVGSLEITHSSIAEPIGEATKRIGVLQPR